AGLARRNGRVNQSEAPAPGRRRRGRALCIGGPYLRLPQRDEGKGAVCTAVKPGDRRQAPDRGHRRLHGNLFLGGLQRLPAAEDLPHLTSPGAGTSRLPPIWTATPGLPGWDMAMITIRKELTKDAAAREALLDVGYGDARFRKVSARLREGRLPAAGLALVACDRGRVVGTVRLWDVSAGIARPALLLGPLTVHPDYRRRGIGSALVRRALDDASRLGHGAVLLVGDAPYYG